MNPQPLMPAEGNTGTPNVVALEEDSKNVMKIAFQV